MTILLACICIMAVQFIDVAYSIYAIERYGLHEGNRAWRWLVKSPGWFMAVSTVAHALVLIGLYAISVPAWALWFGLAVRVVVVIRNVNVVRQEIGRKA